MLADRLDFRPQAGGPAQVNSLQEAYLSWQPSPAQALDVGRINPRGGVALGFNPLDVWRDSGLRAAVSTDPASARHNRLGVVMLRAQQLYDGGSVGVLLAPALAGAANPAPWSPDWGSSNRRERWQLQASVPAAAACARNGCWPAVPAKRCSLAWRPACCWATPPPCTARPAPAGGTIWPLAARAVGGRWVCWGWATPPPRG